MKDPFPSGRVYASSIFTVSAGSINLPTDDNDEKLVLLERSDGSAYGMAQQAGGKPHGVTIAQYESKNPMMYVNYADGIRDGHAMLWREAGTPLLFAEYKRGRRHGFTCGFAEAGELAAVIEYKMNEVTAIRVLEGGPDSAIEFVSEAEAQRDPAAVSALEGIRAAEEELNTNERSFRAQIRKAEERLRRQRVTQLSPVRRENARIRAQQRAAKAQALYESMIRAHMGR
jgi:hypothetical protein